MNWGYSDNWEALFLDKPVVAFLEETSTWIGPVSGEDLCWWALPLNWDIWLNRTAEERWIALRSISSGAWLTPALRRNCKFSLNSETCTSSILLPFYTRFSGCGLWVLVWDSVSLHSLSVRPLDLCGSLVCRQAVVELSSCNCASWFN